MICYNLDAAPGMIVGGDRSGTGQMRGSRRGSGAVTALVAVVSGSGERFRRPRQARRTIGGIHHYNKFLDDFSVHLAVKQRFLSIKICLK